MTRPTMLFTSRSDNMTTGDCPTCWVGPTLAHTHASCVSSGCAYYPPASTGTVCCYAWHGQVHCAFCSVIRYAARNPDRYTIESALQHAIRSARFVRFTAIGDMGIIPEEDWAHALGAIMDEGLAPLGYVVGWRRAPWLRLYLRASCFTDTDEAEAHEVGWLTVRVGPQSMADGSVPPPDGSVVCPHKTGQRVTCGTCGLCQVATHNPRSIWFPHHGSSALTERAALRRGPHD